MNQTARLEKKAGGSFMVRIAGGEFSNAYLSAFAGCYSPLDCVRRSSLGTAHRRRL